MDKRPALPDCQNHTNHMELSRVALSVVQKRKRPHPFILKVKKWFKRLIFRYEPREIAQFGKVVNELIGIGESRPGFENIIVKQLDPDENNRTYFGEVNSEDQRHGKGIWVEVADNEDKYIFLGYSQNGKPSPGSYIMIFWNGNFVIGKLYPDPNNPDKPKWRCTCYYPDGTTKVQD